jgi:hypothetical protein
VVHSEGKSKMPKMMVNLETKFKLDGGEPGEDKDSYNPLARALANLLQTGQPFQRLTQCFVIDDRDQSSKNSSRMRWLGVFVYSAGNRIIFFPGFTDHMTEVHKIHQTEPETRRAFQFDHFTLEPDMQRWHITNLDSTEHISGARTQNLGEDTYLWFGLSIASLDVLRIAKETTVVTALVPSSDAERRKIVFLDARENIVFQILEFHPDIARSDIRVAHFGIIVGRGVNKLYEGDQPGLPDGSLLRQHLMGLSNDRDIQIDTAILPSALTYPVVVTSPSD